MEWQLTMEQALTFRQSISSSRYLRAKPARLAIVPISLGLALALSLASHGVMPFATEYFFLAAVVASAWIGGRACGLLAAALAPFLLDYFFCSPLYTLGISNEARPFIVPFLLSAVAGAWVSSVRRDATTAKRLLHQNEEKFSRILTNLPDIAWTVDERGRVVYIGPRIHELTGYTKQEICANGLTLLLERVHPDDSARLQQSMDDLFSGRSSFHIEFRFQRKDGQWIWVLNRAANSYKQDGVAFADGVICDISPRKRDELELQAKTALLEAQINSTIDGILVVNESGKRILQNQRFIDICEIPARFVSDLDDRPLLNYVAQLVKNPTEFLTRVEHLYSHPEQTSRDEIELTNGKVLDRYSAPVTDQKGRYFGRIWTFHDVTERRRNEETLRRLSLAVEQSPISILITDPKGNISYVNRKFSECTGYEVEEVVNRNPRFLNSGYSSREMYEGLWNTITQGQIWRGELRNKKKNGDFFWESVTITPIVNAGGVITNYVAMKEDITERRFMEAQLRQAQKLEAIGQLAAGIAHEINTPTQFVTDNLVFLRDSWRAASQIIERYRQAIHSQESAIPLELTATLEALEKECELEFITVEVPRAIEQGLDGAKRVATIVRAMKEFSHPDSDEKVEVDLNKAVASTITVARNEWKYVAQMETSFDELLPTVVCYPGEINQVILNLIVNAAHAIKAKTREGTKGRLSISTRARGQFAEVTVSDDGIGIPEAIHTRIFEPFFTTKDVGKGTGQGLAMAYSVIVKKHQGKIWFESEQGKGTTFFIHIPFEGFRQEKEPVS